MGSPSDTAPDGSPKRATFALATAWTSLVLSVLLLLESASLTLTNDESGGLIRIDLLLAFPIGMVAVVGLIGGVVSRTRGQIGGPRAVLISLIALCILALCFIAIHEIFVVTARIFDVLGWEPKDCISDGDSLGFDWGRYCPVS